MFGSDQPFVAMSLDESDTESPELVYFSDLPLQKGASWVHALSLGTFEHPLHGTVTITPERVQRLADGVNNRVRGQDLDVDYDHKARTGEAAGWVRKAEARPDGLWLFVEWTKEALGKIKSRAYRYFSSEFVEKWKDPKSGTVHKDVLFGGGITNRPFLKDLVPINLSELVAEPTSGGYHMDRAQLEKLARRLGVTFEDGTSDEDLQAAVDKAVDEEPPKKDDTTDDSQTDGEQEREPVAASESLLKLAEDNPEIKALLDEREETNKRLTALEATQQLSEIEVAVTRLSEKTDGEHVMSPKLNDKLRQLLMGLPRPQVSKVTTFLTELLGPEGMVALSETPAGREHDERPSGADAASEGFLKAVDDYIKKFAEKGETISYADAVEAVSLAEPQLASAYAEAARGWKEI